MKMNKEKIIMKKYSKKQFYQSEINWIKRNKNNYNYSNKNKNKKKK